MMKVIPVTMKQANEFVLSYHRHHGKVRGCKFCIGATDEDGILHGVATPTPKTQAFSGNPGVGRPVSRYLDNGSTAEVTRLCTDGYRNACSFLYGACVQIARQMGYARLLTYILDSENGASLRASGWKDKGICGGGNWNVPSRPRADSRNSGRKRCYYKELR